MTYDDSDCLVICDGNNGRVCTKCGEFKLWELFRLSSTGKNGRHPWCKECDAKRAREYRAKNKEAINLKGREYYRANKDKIRAYFRQRTYGITPDEYEQKVESQQGGCAICGEIPSGTGNHSMLHVDHDHDTNEVRDLLCGNCNLAVGHVRESPEIARKVADYLERWGK